MKRIALVFLCLPFAAYGAERQASPSTKPADPDSGYRTWTDASGNFKIEAKLGRVADGKAELVKRDGTEVSLPLAKLSLADRQDMKKRALADKRAEHTSWINIKAQGLRSVASDNPTTYMAVGKPEFGTVHHYSQQVRKCTYSQPFQGDLVSYVSNFATIDVWTYRAKDGSGYVAINKANWQELTTLPRVGRKLAEAIVQSREQSGPFKNIDDLRRVTGIGDRTLDSLRPHLQPPPQSELVRGDSVRQTINVNNLDAASQKFLTDYRNLEKSFEAVESKPQPQPKRNVANGDSKK